LKVFAWATHLLLPCLFALSAGAALAAEPSIDVKVEQQGEIIVVDATVNVQVSVASAWEVLTDFDHMASILANLTSSKVASRNGNTWIVHQAGTARYGLLSFPFESEREIRMEPMTQIRARNLSGTLKRMESEANLVAFEQGVKIKYHAEIVPDSLLMRIFGTSFIGHEVAEQFMDMAKEMIRRTPRLEKTTSTSG